MVAVIKGNFGPRAPDDLPRILRELADQVERGEVTAMVAAVICNDEPQLHWSASLWDSVVLSSLLQARAVKRMEED
jgi:hypothetical protein